MQIYFLVQGFDNIPIQKSKIRFIFKIDSELDNRVKQNMKTIRLGSSFGIQSWPDHYYVYMSAKFSPQHSSVLMLLSIIVARMFDNVWFLDNFMVYHNIITIWLPVTQLPAHYGQEEEREFILKKNFLFPDSDIRILKIK